MQYEDLLEVSEQKVEIEGQRRYEIYDVDGSAKKRQSARADDETDEQFEGEPAVADRLDVEEGIVRDRSTLVQQPGLRRAHGRVAAVARAPDVDAGRQRQVLDRRHSHVGMSFEAEREDRDDDEKHRQRRNYLKYTSTDYYRYCIGIITTAP